jgi:hypothetical protein
VRTWGGGVWAYWWRNVKGRVYGVGALRIRCFFYVSML